MGSTLGPLASFQRSEIRINVSHVVYDVAVAVLVKAPSKGPYDQPWSGRRSSSKRDGAVTQAGISSGLEGRTRVLLVYLESSLVAQNEYCRGLENNHYAIEIYWGV